MARSNCFSIRFGLGITSRRLAKDVSKRDRTCLGFVGTGDPRCKYAGPEELIAKKYLSGLSSIPRQNPTPT